MALGRHWRLDDLEDPRLVGDADPPGLLRSAAELRELPVTPLRLHIARRKHRHQSADSGQAFEDGVGEEVVALKLRIAPDPGLLAEELTDTDLQQPVQA